MAVPKPYAMSHDVKKESQGRYGSNQATEQLPEKYQHFYIKYWMTCSRTVSLEETS